jgi:hypothetical protein
VKVLAATIALVLTFTGTAYAAPRKVVNLNTRQGVEMLDDLIERNNVRITQREAREILEIIRTVSDAGVRVLYDPNETESCGYVGDGKFVIGPESTNESSCGPLVETFRHETFHLVQVCVNRRVGPIGIETSQEALDEMNSTTGYTSEQQEYEIEAFEAERHPGASVKMLNLCLRGELKPEPVRDDIKK